MKFKYVGSGDDSPRETTVFGLKFERDGDAVEVKNEGHQKKLKGNSSFVEVKGRKKAPKKKEADDEVNDDGDTSQSTEESASEIGDFLSGSDSEG